MRQRGGRIIGSGSQGCIFSPKLEKRNEGGRVIARRSGNETAISKVFSKQSVWEGEHTIMQAVSAAVRDARTGEVKGVVLYTHEEYPFYTANNLNPENKAELERRDIGTGCTKLRGATKYYILNQPKIDGDLQNFYAKPGKAMRKEQPAFFLDAYNALMKMRINGLVHMDLASRNIFYNAESAFIGDFGLTINLSGDPIQLQTSLSERGFDDMDPASAFNSDSITPEAFMALTIMQNWSRKQEYLGYVNYDRFREMFRKDVAGYDPAENTRDESGYIIFKDGSLYEKYQDVFTQAGTMKDIDFTKYTYELLLKSDIKRFIIVITRFLDISLDKKHELLNRVLNHDNFNFFYEIVGVAVPDFSAAAEAGGGGGGGRTAAGGAGRAPNYGASAAAAHVEPSANNNNLYMNAIIIHTSQLFSDEHFTPIEIERILSQLRDDSIEFIKQQVQINNKIKESIMNKIKSVIIYYESNPELKIPEIVRENINKILPFLRSSGGGRRRHTIARRRRAQKTRKHNRV